MLLNHIIEGNPIIEKIKIDPSKSSEVLSGLKRATRYFAELHSVPVRKPVHSPPSIVQTSFTTLLPPPNITKIETSENSAVFTWEESISDRVAFTYLQQGDHLDKKDWQLKKLGTDDRQLEISGLQSDSLYLLQLKFMGDDPNTDNEQAFQEFKTKATNIVRISKPIASAVTFNSATIVWDTESGSVDGYKVGRQYIYVNHDSIERN